MNSPPLFKSGMKPISSCTGIVAVSDGLRLKVIRDMLLNLKVGHVEVCGDGAAAIFAIQLLKNADFVIAQEDLAINPCLDIIHFVRRSPDSPRKDLPVICIGWRWTEDKIKIYRDSGVNYIVSYPVSFYTMQRRLFSAIYSGRLFVSTETYCGPDRRYHRAPQYVGPYRRWDDRPPQEKVEAGDPPEAIPAPSPAMSQFDLRRILSEPVKKDDKSG